jgi:hypothetical protein
VAVLLTVVSYNVAQFRQELAKDLKEASLVSSQQVEYSKKTKIKTVSLN